MPVEVHPHRVTYARELADRMTAALDTPELVNVLVTLDALKIPSAARNGVIHIAPPGLRFPTFTQVESTFEVTIISGPPQDVVTAWERLDRIIDALVTARLDLASAEPDYFVTKNGTGYPAYTLTLNPALFTHEL